MISPVQGRRDRAARCVRAAPRRDVRRSRVVAL